MIDAQRASEWDVAKDLGIVKAAKFTKEEWDVLRDPWGGKMDRDSVQMAILADPAKAQLIYQGYDKMGYGYILMGDIAGSVSICMDMAVIKHWAEEVGVTLVDTEH